MSDPRNKSATQQPLGIGKQPDEAQRSGDFRAEGTSSEIQSLSTTPTQSQLTSVPHAKDFSRSTIDAGQGSSSSVRSSAPSQVSTIRKDESFTSVGMLIRQVFCRITVHSPGNPSESLAEHWSRWSCRDAVPALRGRLFERHECLGF
jgi:hypothetical protein